MIKKKTLKHEVILTCLYFQDLCVAAHFFPPHKHIDKWHPLLYTHKNTEHPSTLELKHSITSLKVAVWQMVHRFCHEHSGTNMRRSRQPSGVCAPHRWTDGRDTRWLQGRLNQFIFKHRNKKCVWFGLKGLELSLN